MGEEAYNKALAISTTTADIVCLAGAVKNTVKGIRDAKAAKGMPEEVPTEVPKIEEPNLAEIEKQADLEGEFYEDIFESQRADIPEYEDYLSDLVEAQNDYVKPSRTKAEILQQNKAKGRAFEKQEFAKFSAKYNNAAEQVTIKTPSGTRTRVDAIGLDADGKIVIYEFKSSLTAPLTKNQRVAFEEILKSGGVVVGKGEGKGIFKGGKLIEAGTEVKIIRPN